MLRFMPPLYDDELCYSWIMRYYVRSGYLACMNARDDFNLSQDYTFQIEHLAVLNENVKQIIEKTITVKDLILKHTMFPIIRFADNERIKEALSNMTNKNSSKRLKVFNRRGLQNIRYCPCCVSEQREKYGEAFLSRMFFIPKVDYCPKHGCRLAETEHKISAKESIPYIVELEADNNIEPEHIRSEHEMDFIRYVYKAFSYPIDFGNNVTIPSFLKSKLEGTDYLSINGEQINHDRLIRDIIDFYTDFENRGLTEKHRLKHLFGGYNIDYYEVCQVAYYLGITAEELTFPRIPECSQSRLFYEKVSELHATGLSFKTIAGRYNVNEEALIKRISGNNVKPINHGSASTKGVKKIDWDTMDLVLLPRVKEICRDIFYNDEKGPGRVSYLGVTTKLDISYHRIKNMPNCLKEVEGYLEKKEEYWARKVVWAYRKLREEGYKHIPYHPAMLRRVNVPKKDIVRCIPYISNYCENAELRDILVILQ